MGMGWEARGWGAGRGVGPGVRARASGKNVERRGEKEMPRTTRRHGAAPAMALFDGLEAQFRRMDRVCEALA